MIMRRLLNKKGSVLFLVVVVMSILIIAASATFYIVNNQHSSVNVRYSSEQSYQTAVSVSKTVSDFIDGYGKKLKDKQIDGTNYEDNILAQLVSLNDNEQFDATQSLSDLEMGDVKITIKKQNHYELNDENKTTVHNFEITTTATVNGETSSVTQCKAISTAQQVQTAEPFTRFLTSTGKGSDSRDTYIRAGYILGDAFFENEWTQLMSDVNCSVYSSKSFYDMGVKYNKPKGDNPAAGNNWEMVIGENFFSINEGGSGVYEQFDNVFVGGDMKLSHTWNAKMNYIRGDLEISGNLDQPEKFFVKGDCHISGTNNLQNNTFYINGDLYLNVDDYVAWSTQMGNLFVNGDVYFNGNKAVKDGSSFEAQVYGTPVTLGFCSAVSSTAIETAMQNVIPQPGADDFTIENWDDVDEYISAKASKNEYTEWDAEKYFIDKIEGKGLSAGTIIPGVTNIVDPDPDVPNTKTCYTDMTSYGYQTCIITQSCRLRRSDFKEGGVSTHGNILIDTTDATGPIYIYLEPELGETVFNFAGGGTITNVLTMGTYPVVFILPKTCDYVSDFHSYIGHVDIPMELGGFSSIDELLSVGDNNIFYWGQFGSEASAVQVLLEEDNGYFKFKNGIGKTGTLHNNIFLVSNGDNKNFDFNRQSTFAGYIYAPYSHLEADYGTQSISFIGGLVVSNFTYSNTTGSLVFTSPYDYHGNYTYDTGNGEDEGCIVDKLMADSGGKKPGGDGASTVVSEVKTIGYK